MNTIFIDYLFSKHILVYDGGRKDQAFETLFSLANLFNIRVVSGQTLAEPEMIRTAQRCLGANVPLPFYRGFPNSVRALTPQALLFDQLLHYFRSYCLGDLTEAGKSVLEEEFPRLAFREQAEIRDFSIITRKEAIRVLARSVDDLLAGTRPLSQSQYELVLAYIQEYGYTVSHCASRDTAVKLLLDTRDISLAAFLRLSDVIRILDHINYRDYHNRNLKQLNLKNQDRKFLKRIINTIFLEGQCNVIDCFEQKKIWNGLLHHLHYKPVNRTARKFVAAMRGKGNQSVYSAFEKHMHRGEIREAVETLRDGKGSGALLRKLTYILSRCETPEEVGAVMDNIRTHNALILIQLLMNYSGCNDADAPRTFRFTKHNLLRTHPETDEEYRRRQSVLSSRIQAMVVQRLWENLEDICRDRLGKVFIAPGMENIALPLQETASSGGYGVLPRGSRIPIRAGKKIRGFTYWERVQDIDLSIIGLTRDNEELEFSWRSMSGSQSEAITYSGDQTRGYHGGSEYFDVDLEAFIAMYPETEYLIFCNNVYTGTPFSQCICKAGYMDRDILDSGQVFEPKTVATSFQVTCESTFAYLFAIDLARKQLVWLNVNGDSWEQVAGTTSLSFLRAYLNQAQVINLRRLFTLLATEIVEDPSQADVVVCDEPVAVKEGAEIIHSYDTERILALLNS